MRRLNITDETNRIIGHVERPCPPDTPPQLLRYEPWLDCYRPDRGQPPVAAELSAKIDGTADDMLARFKRVDERLSALRALAELAVRSRLAGREEARIAARRAINSDVFVNSTQERGRLCRLVDQAVHNA